MAHMTGLSGLSDMEGNSGTIPRRRSRRKTHLHKPGGNSLGRRRNSIMDNLMDNNTREAMQKRINKLRSWARTMMKNSKADRKRIKQLLAQCQGPRILKELRSWPLTLDADGRICVHGWDSAIVDLRGAKHLPPLAVIEAGLDLRDSTELSHIESLQVDGVLDLRGAVQLEHLPEDLTAFDLLLSGCTALTCLPQGMTVERDINLEGCSNFEELPNSFRRVKGSFVLNDCCSIVELPRELSVDRTLSLIGCTSLKTLPLKRLHVGGDLHLDNCTALEAIQSRSFYVEQVVSLKYCTSLTTLPENMHVTRLDLSGCSALVSLPKNLVVDGDLDLCECVNLKALPDGLRVGGSLDMSGCTEIDHLPPRLNVGGDLFLRGCESLTHLPDDLVVGGDLHLENCIALTRLPGSILEWGCSSDPLWYGDTRNVYLAGTGLDPNELSRIRNANAPGIQFHVAIDEHNPFAERFESLAEALQAWECSLPVAQYVSKAYERGIILFLSHLRLSREYEDEIMRPGLVSRVNEVLQLICSDETCRGEIITRMNDSVDACGDKPIWALNQMTLISRVAQARHDAGALRHVGLGVMRLGVVHEHVRRKIKALGFVDDVCVYLAFEIALKDELDLPVSAAAMKFPNYIQVEPHELEDARKDALAISQSAFEMWLSHWPEWERYQREQAALAYDEIQQTVHRSVAGLCDLTGDPARDPVLLGQAVWAYHDLLPHWLQTGMDLNNTPWTPEDFNFHLFRILPPRPCSERLSTSRESLRTSGRFPSQPHLEEYLLSDDDETDSDSEDDDPHERLL